MRKSKLIAAVLAGSLALSSPFSLAGTITPPAVPSSHFPAVGWVLFGCVGDVVAAAWVANFVYHRQLTAAEAATCGLAFWLNPNNKKL